MSMLERVKEWADISAEVVNELANQYEKWGDQSGHSDGTGANVYVLSRTDPNLDRCKASELERIFKDKYERASVNTRTWRDILLEEVFEAFATGTEDELRHELIQVAAVAMQWVHAIDTRE